MNSDNPHHNYQLGFLIIAFVILLVGTTLMYKVFVNPAMPVGNIDNDQENLLQRLAKPGSFTPEEEAELNTRLETSGSFTPEEKNDLNNRLNKRE